MATVEQLPSGKWRARVRVTGFPAKSKSFRTKKLATVWGHQLEDKLVAGIDTTGSIPADFLVENLLDWYERTITHRKKGHACESYRIATLSKKMGAIRLSALDPQSIIDFVDVRLTTVCSDTVRRELTVLSAAIEAVIALKGFKFDNPVKTAKKILGHTNTLTPPIKRDRRLVGDEYERILTYLAAANPVMSDVFMLLVESAMRRGDLVKFRGPDLRAGGLLITDDKTDKTTVIPLSVRAREILKRYPDGFGLRPGSISQCFNRVCKRLKIDDLRIHDLRHEAASRFFERGLSIVQVASITRHSSWEQLKRYTHLDNADTERLLG
jgi:integrase